MDNFPPKPRTQCDFDQENKIQKWMVPAVLDDALSTVSSSKDGLNTIHYIGGRLAKSTKERLQA